MTVSILFRAILLFKEPPCSTCTLMDHPRRKSDEETTDDM